jgi:hypothetical protein
MFIKLFQNFTFMNKNLCFTFLVLMISSCVQNKEKNTDLLLVESQPAITGTDSTYDDNYSNEFQLNVKSKGGILRSDSIFFPNEADFPYILIPQFIPINKKIVFRSKNGHRISITQTNYTDIEFTIQYKNQEYKGKAFLYPHFYFGSETVVFSDEEYVMTPYYIAESNHPSLDYIGFGNQNIAEVGTEEVYAIIGISGDNCETEFSEMSKQKLIKSN